MSRPAVGDRVGAIKGTNPDGSVSFFGWGVYEGDREPLPETIFMFLPWKDRGIDLEGLTNPCILLDSGERVFGCECWWGSEAGVQSMLLGKTVVPVSITEERARIAAEAGCEHGT